MDGLLAELPAGSLDEWWQYYQLQPWGDDWDRTSMLAAQLSNCLLAIASSFGGKKPDLIETDAFVPWRQMVEQQADRQAQMAALDRLEAF